MTTIYTGECVGGPLAGQRLVSTVPNYKTIVHKTVAWPELCWPVPDEGTSRREPVDIITYRHVQDETGEWWVL